MTKDQDTIRELRRICNERGEAITRLSAANKKLRDELADERNNYNVMERAFRWEQTMTTAWQQAHRQLAEAIGGRPK